ncbi:MAG: sigma-70 family RNA polymerase sigma factor [Candidatus Portnoybacteria bacterium]|nr:sigma-70 family RNA polymerase sigma factor [Candidatus Portnoybacteria bacterium]
MTKIEQVDKEKELLSKAISGDKESFGQLYDFYAPRIFRYIRLKVGSQALAEDLTSESFLRMWNFMQKEGTEIEESFKALLYKIAKNLIADYYKRKSSHEVLLDDDFKEFLLQEPAKDEIKSKESAEEIHKALVLIKEDYQNVIIWYYVDELSVSEIAELMDKTEGAVRVLIHRALKSLKKELE